ncbi:MAG: hypothetical protein AAF488_13920 [Planctomycetota bacterium]
MVRYASTFALLGFVVTIVAAFYSEVPIGDVIERAVFWATLCGLLGVAVSIVVDRMVSEMALPTVEEEIEAEKHERELRSYRETMRELAERFPRESRTSESSPEKPQAGIPKPDNALGENSSPAESPAVG